MSSKLDYASLMDVDDRELLARYIYYPSEMIEDGELTPFAFELVNFKDGSRERFVSVSLLKDRDIKKDDVPIPNRYKKENAQAYGYAKILTSDVRKASYRYIHTEVKDYGNENNPYHAGIHYFKDQEMIIGLYDDPAYLFTLKLLANASTLVKF